MQLFLMSRGVASTWLYLLRGDLPVLHCGKPLRPASETPINTVSSKLQLPPRFAPPNLKAERINPESKQSRCKPASPVQTLISSSSLTQCTLNPKPHPPEAQFRFRYVPGSGVHMSEAPEWDECMCHHVPKLRVHSKHH